MYLKISPELISKAKEFMFNLFVFLLFCGLGIAQMIKGYPFYDPDVQQALMFPILVGIAFCSWLLTKKILKTLQRRFHFMKSLSKKIYGYWVSVVLISFVSFLSLSTGYFLTISHFAHKNNYSVELEWDKTTNMWKFTHLKLGKVFKVSYSQYHPHTLVAPILPPEISMGPEGYVFNKLKELNG